MANALQQPAAWWVPLVTYDCFRCLGASRGRLTSKGCSLLPRQDRQGSSPTSLESGALQWPSPRCSLGQSQHQQVKRAVCLWVINRFLAKAIKMGSKEVLIETSSYPVPWPLTPRQVICTRNAEPSEVPVHNYLKTLKQPQDLFKAISLWWNDFTDLTLRKDEGRLSKTWYFRRNFMLPSVNTLDM